MTLSKLVRALVPLAGAVAALLATRNATATDYEVGPGKKYAAIGDVPWESLGPGDQVHVDAAQHHHARRGVLSHQTGPA